MKKYLYISLACAIAIVFYAIFAQHQNQLPKTGNQYFFNAPTTATTSIGSSTQTLVLAADAARSFASFCNSTTTANTYIYIQVSATGTAPFGYPVAGGTCYPMTPETGNLFTGNIYAQTVAGTSTLITVSTSKSN